MKPEILRRILGLKLKFFRRKKNLTVNDLKNSDELFFTGTATEVVGVVSIDGDNISDGLPGKLTNTIRKKYLDIVNGRDNQYSHYLEKVT